MRVDEVPEIFVYTGNSGDLRDGEIVDNVDEDEVRERHQAQVRPGAVMVILRLLLLRRSVGC